LCILTDVKINPPQYSFKKKKTQNQNPVCSVLPQGKFEYRTSLIHPYPFQHSLPLIYFVTFNVHSVQT